MKALPLACAASLTAALIVLSLTTAPATAQPIPFTYVLVDANGPNTLWLKSVGDLNDDGLPDLVAGGQSSGGLVWYENPAWTKRTIDGDAKPGTDGEVADVDGDGLNDLVSIEYGTTKSLRWYQNPTWSFYTIDLVTIHDVEVADFDGDGDVDVVARNQSAFGGDGDDLYFYRQDTSTSWTKRTIPCPNGEGLKVSDLDGDGDADVLVNGSWFENTGDIINGLWSEHVYTSSWTHPHVYIATGDINGDGRLDIALSPAELKGQTYRISWFEAPLDATQENWVEHVVASNMEAVHHFVGAADFDQDGDVDIATAEMAQSSNPDELKIYVNGGGGQSWTPEVVATTALHSVRVLDVDNDGDPDLYGADHQGNEVELWINQSNLLPVELVSFDAVTDGVDVLLKWKTASETNNAGFEIQRRGAEDEEWHVAGFVEGAGTTLEPQTYSFRLEDQQSGTYTFRLRQIDFDGTFEYSPAVEVVVDLPGAFYLSPAWPNPFNPSTTFRVLVGRSQHVRVEVLNMLGQRVALLHEGMLSAGESHTFVLDAKDLPSGPYLYRVIGEAFTTARNVMLVK